MKPKRIHRLYRDLYLRACQHDVTPDFSPPGKPTDNACTECVNGEFRAECLNAHWFPGARRRLRKGGGLVQGLQ